MASDKLSALEQELLQHLMRSADNSQRLVEKLEDATRMWRELTVMNVDSLVTSVSSLQESQIELLTYLIESEATSPGLVMLAERQLRRIAEDEARHKSQIYPPGGAT